MFTYIYMYVYIYIYTCLYMYVYMYSSRYIGVIGYRNKWHQLYLQVLVSMCIDA